MYFVIHAIDSDSANARVAIERRQAFFDGFRVVPPKGAGGGNTLTGEHVAALGRVFGAIVTR